MTNDVEITWLAQAGFLLAGDETRILLDPFPSEHEARLIAPPDLCSITEAIDLVLVTHEHLDHLDVGFLPTLVGRSPQARIVVPAPLVARVEELLPGAAVHGVDVGDVVRVGAATVTVTSATHAVEVADGYSDGRATPGAPARFVGYLVAFERAVIYHSGDTLVTDELIASLDGVAVDVALLPVNGRDHFREAAGLVGNMSVREAVHFAHRIGARTLVPMHWDLFAGNTERPGAAAEAAHEIDAPLHVLNLARYVPYRI
jgi:L-ascorbate 6-phosphate lactonase